MKSKLAWLVLGATVFGLCVRAETQLPTHIHKIGWLSAGSRANTGQQEVIRILRELGYVNGQNISFEFHYAANRLDRLPLLAEELVSRKVDVLITPGTPGALALRNATKTIPIIFADVTDPVGAGLVESLARPGGNLTGFSSIESVLAGKRLELLNETISELSRVAVLHDPQNPGSQQEWKESQRAAHELGLQLHSMEVSSADKYEKAFENAVKARSAALAVLSNPLAAFNQQRIADLAAKHRLPSIYVRREFVASGGLMSYGGDQTVRFRRVAVLIDKILKGANPAELPVEQPTKFELVINLKTAKQIGLTIPPNVLTRADKVIK
jgi:putative tryptophan/tyrosine transport system substrate-binding protein